jgi:hypothetical protein
MSKYWYLEKTVSNNFNRLKAKVFNLIDASITDKQQATAVKGLIKGFANDEYRLCISDMRYTARNAEYIASEDSNVPDLGGDPLENTLE